MPNHYNVQGCLILGTEIMRVRSLPNFASMIFSFKPGSGNNLDLTVIAADTNDRPLPGSSVDVDSYNQKQITLRENDFIPRPIFVTSDMIDELLTARIFFNSVRVKILSMEFGAKEFKYHGDDHPHDKHKEFVGFKVKIRREKK